MNNRLKKDENRKPLLNDYKTLKKTKNEKNEVVNTALKKLAKTYNSNDIKPRPPRIREHGFLDPYKNRFLGPQDANSLKSKSELSTPLKKDNSNAKASFPSSPVIQSSYEKGDFLEKVEPFQNKFTMTKLNTVVDYKSKEGKKLITEMSRENPVWKDHRLVEKYSILKVPWRRSYTLPVYSTQPSVFLKEEFNKKIKDYSDKKTYLYDDGSDIDSMFYNETNSVQYFGYTFQSQVLALLTISAYMCALLFLSLIVWFVSGNKLFYNLLIPKQPEDPFKKYIKYVGGGIIYTISSIIRFIGRIFAIPTQQLYHPAAEYSWPPLT